MRDGDAPGSAALPSPSTRAAGALSSPFTHPVARSVTCVALCLRSSRATTRSRPASWASLGACMPLPLPHPATRAAARETHRGNVTAVKTRPTACTQDLPLVAQGCAMGALHGAARRAGGRGVAVPLEAGPHVIGDSCHAQHDVGTTWGTSWAMDAAWCATGRV